MFLKYKNEILFLLFCKLIVVPIIAFAEPDQRDTFIQKAKVEYELAKKFSNCAAFFNASRDFMKKLGQADTAQVYNDTSNGAFVASKVMLSLADFSKMFSKHTVEEIAAKPDLLKSIFSNHEVFYASIYDVQYPYHRMLIFDKDTAVTEKHFTQQMQECSALSELQGKIGAEFKEHLHGGDMSDNLYVRPEIWGERAR